MSYKQVCISSGELHSAGIYLDANISIQFKESLALEIDKNKIKELLNDLLYDVLAEIE